MKKVLDMKISPDIRSEKGLEYLAQDKVKLV